MQPSQKGKTDTDAVVERLAEMPVFVGRIAADMAGDLQRWKPADDDWSLVEQVCHLRDLEVEGYGVRISRLVNEERPELADFDGARVALERNYVADSLDAALGAFSAARAANLDRIAALTSDELGRTGLLEGVGEITIERLLSNMCEHDDEHRRQITTLHEQFSQTR
ncbi:MAG TPA: DinB family protein [Blastocatellia bacterium]|nr:DinB family protein [Blastocatellia bacterium]